MLFACPLIIINNTFVKFLSGKFAFRKEYLSTRMRERFGPVDRDFHQVLSPDNMTFKDIGYFTSKALHLASMANT